LKKSRTGANEITWATPTQVYNYQTWRCKNQRVEASLVCGDITMAKKGIMLWKEFIRLGNVHI